VIDVMARAEQIAAMVPAAARPTTDVRKVNGWGVLVEPMPTYEFAMLQGGTFGLRWLLYAIAFNPAGREAAVKLHELVQLVAGSELAIVSATPALYPLPDRSDPAPAYQMVIEDGDD
jgi:hypothetical protein